MAINFFFFIDIPHPDLGPCTLNWFVALLCVLLKFRLSKKLSLTSFPQAWSSQRLEGGFSRYGLKYKKLFFLQKIFEYNVARCNVLLTMPFVLPLCAKQSKIFLSNDQTLGLHRTCLKSTFLIAASVLLILMKPS